MTALTAALAALIASALPLRQFLGLDQPAPYPEWVIEQMIEEDHDDPA